MEERRRKDASGRGRRRTPRTDGSAAGPSGLTAADIMERRVHKVRPETPVDDVSQLVQVHNINGAPVVDAQGNLVGIITEDDLVFGEMGLSDGELASRGSGGLLGAPGPGAALGLVDPEGRTTPRLVGEIMTPRPFAAEEGTPVEELCRLMCQLRIHRLPIVRKRKVTGIVSTVDICRLVAEGRVRLVPTGK